MPSIKADPAAPPQYREVEELRRVGNREVAAQLFMHLKTVEANLARVYRKPGIHSRAQLGARLASTRASGPKRRETPDYFSGAAA